MPNLIPKRTDQSRARAGRNIVAGDYNEQTNNYYFPDYDGARDVINSLAERLMAEIEMEDFVADDVANLAYFKRRRQAPDGVVGLKAKLEKGQRSDLWFQAQEEKVEFEKLLEEWALYASAQEIFAEVLAKVERRFNRHAKPRFSEISLIDADILIDKLVIDPAVRDCAGVAQFRLNSTRAIGMLYWLADRCFIKWHK